MRHVRYRRRKLSPKELELRALHEKAHMRLTVLSNGFARELERSCDGEEIQAVLESMNELLPTAIAEDIATDPWKQRKPHVTRVTVIKGKKKRGAA